MESLNDVFNFLIGLFVTVVVIATAYGVFYKPPTKPPDFWDRG
jgi:hypothetical protein